MSRAAEEIGTVEVLQRGCRRGARREQQLAQDIRLFDAGRRRRGALHCLLQIVARLVACCSFEVLSKIEDGCILQFSHEASGVLGDEAGNQREEEWGLGGAGHACHACPVASLFLRGVENREIIHPKWTA
eukprot:780212-Pleurochrysis_carterae.AAC.2